MLHRRGFCVRKMRTTIAVATALPVVLGSYVAVGIVSPSSAGRAFADTLAPGTISTLAGNGTSGSSGLNGPATAAQLATPNGVAVDSAGNVYIIERSGTAVQKVDPSGRITLFAGGGTDTFSGDGGPAVSASFIYTSGIAVGPDGSVYISTLGRIRKVNPAGIISTVAGNGTGGYSGDGGPATSAGITPRGLTLDTAGNIYFADTNRVRKVNTAGIVSTIAGNGTHGFSGDGGPAVSAALNQPSGVAVDASGDVIIADTCNNRIRKVNTSGVITSLAGITFSYPTSPDGNGCLDNMGGFSGDGGPASSAAINNPEGIAIDSAGDVFFTDSGNYLSELTERVRVINSAGIISSVVGNGTDGYSGDGGPATAAALNLDVGSGVAVADDGSLYIGDSGNNRVRMVTGNGPAPVTPTGGPVQSSEHLGKNGSELNCHVCAGDPVDTADGDFYESAADLLIPGPGLPLSFSRSYNSLAAGVGGPLGFGWQDSYGMALQVDSGSGNVTVTQETGSQVVFTPSGSSFAAPPRVLASLIHNGDGTWTFTRRLRDTYTFDSSGRLTAERDLNHYTTQLAYDGSGRLSVVTDAVGRTLSLGYNTSNQLTSVTDFSGRSVSYGYDTSGNLHTVTDLAGGVTSYTYDASHRLLTLQQPGGYVMTNTYDAASRVTTQTDNLSRQTTFSYSTNQTTVTDPNGNVTVDTYSGGALVKHVTGYGTPQAAVWSYQYDPATMAVTRTVDPTGAVTRATYDGNGDVLSQTDPDGRATSYTYDSLGDVTAVTDPLNVTTTLTYDTSGNLLGESTPLVGSSPAVSQSTGYTYGNAALPSLPTTSTDPNGHITTSTYDANGYLTSVTDPAGDKTTYTYNTIGQRLTQVAPKGNVSGGVPANFTTTYSYDAQGNLVKTIDPLGHRQLLRTYDADGNLLTSTDANNNVTSYAYDLADELKTVTQADTTTLTYIYDGDGNRITSTDANAHTTHYAFTDAALPSAVTATTDPDGRTTTDSYDGAGRVISIQQPGGNCAASPAVGCIQRGYDNAGQLTRITYSDGTTANVTETYDLDGQRTSMTDASGTSSWGWNSLHQLTSTTNGAGATIGYGYDLVGNTTGIVYPGTTGTVTRSYDIAGRLHTVTDWSAHTTTYNYDANSNLTSQVYPNGTTATFAPNAANQISSISDAPSGAPSSPFASMTYSRDAANQVTTSATTGLPTDSNSFTYTPFNQLSAVNSASYGYDPAGNPTRLINSASQTFDPADELTSTTPRITLLGTAKTTVSSSKTANLTLPTGVLANDQVVVAVTMPHTQTVSTPTGYTLVGTYNSGTGSTSASVAVLIHTAAGAETSLSLSFGSNKYPAVITAAVYRGVDPVNPVDATSSASTAGGTNVVAPAVSTSAVNDQLVLVEGANASSTAGTWTQPSGVTPEVQQAFSTSLDAAMGDKFQSAVGSTGAQTSSFSVSAQLVTVLLALRAQATNYSYNSEGDRTAMTPVGGTGPSLTYDQADRLIGYGTTTTYKYNGDGLRTSKSVSGTTQAYTWDRSSGTPTVIVDGSTNYVYGLGGRPLEQISTTGTLYYYQDQLGSTRALANSAGAVVATYSYTPYGKVSGSTGSAANPLQYVGGYSDTESGFLYLQHRYYDSATAQFLTVDPALAITGQPYAYADDDPVDGSDPTGQMCFSLHCAAHNLSSAAHAVASAAVDTGHAVAGAATSVASGVANGATWIGNHPGEALGIAALTVGVIGISIATFGAGDAVIFAGVAFAGADTAGGITIGAAADVLATTLGAGAAAFDCSSDPLSVTCAVDIASVGLGGLGTISDFGFAPRGFGLSLNGGSGLLGGYGLYRAFSGEGDRRSAC